MLNQEVIKWEKHETDSDFINLEINESIVGTYLGKEPSTKYNGTFNFKFDFGEKGIKYIGGKVIDSHIDDPKNPIKEGTVVKILYKGKPHGKNYHDYELFTGVNK